MEETSWIYTNYVNGDCHINFCFSLDTLCYCDSFCERDHSPDCCPDYQTFCKGLPPPPPLTTCLHNGKYYNYSQTMRENCNTCKCGAEGRMTCTNDVCITDEALVHNVNLISSSLGWEARNHSEFWGRTLKEGLKLRLGKLWMEGQRQGWPRILYVIGVN